MEHVLEILFVAMGLAAGYFFGRKSAHQISQDRLIQLEKELTRFETEKVHLESELKTQRDEFTQVRAQFQTHFENTAQKILEKNSDKLREQSERNLQTILTPLKERITDFEKKVEDTYRLETRERFALKEELKRIVELNQQMTLEATNLTRALKSDVKTQGVWGEIILERILSQSGLRAGEEYVTQGQDLKLKSDEGDHQKPDVILKLPDGKHLIIDSKVSLKAYEIFCSTTVDSERERSLKGFLDSVYKHVDGLSAKHYESLVELRSPDFVLLFMPMEAAFSLALQKDSDLVAYAWGKKIAFVSPTTLLVTLGTIASLWKTERQNKNALEIARQGGALYDKLAAFVGDLERIGKNIEDTSRSYNDAFSKLKDGKGNLLSRAENLRKLGAKTSKEISAKHLPDEPTDSLEAPSNNDLD